MVRGFLGFFFSNDNSGMFSPLLVRVLGGIQACLTSPELRRKLLLRRGPPLYPPSDTSLLGESGGVLLLSPPERPEAVESGDLLGEVLEPVSELLF